MRKGTERLIFIKAFEVLCDADLPRRYCEVKDLAVFAKARRIRAVSWEELPLSMLLLAALLATGIVCGYLFAGNCAAEPPILMSAKFFNQNLKEETMKTHTFANVIIQDLSSIIALRFLAAHFRWNLPRL